MVVMLEDPELTSTHKDTKSTAIYAIIPSEKDLKLAKQLLYIKKEKGHTEVGRRG